MQAELAAKGKGSFRRYRSSKPSLSRRSVCRYVLLCRNLPRNIVFREGWRACHYQCHKNRITNRANTSIDEDLKPKMHTLYIGKEQPMYRSKRAKSRSQGVSSIAQRKVTQWQIHGPRQTQGKYRAISVMSWEITLNQTTKIRDYCRKPRLQDVIWSRRGQTDKLNCRSSVYIVHCITKNVSERLDLMKVGTNTTNKAGPRMG